MSTAVEVRYTPERYFALERPALERSEYFDGCIRPMARSNRYHSLITGNILTTIAEQLRDRPEHVYAVQMRTRFGPTRPYTYPDVVAVVGESLFEDEETDTLLNPAVVEVYTPETEALDRSEKFVRCRQHETVREYVLVAQERVHVERYTRRGRDWVLTEFDHLDAILWLSSIGCDVPLRRVYAKAPLFGQG
jgi:Uma2 family endonuclease